MDKDSRMASLTASFLLASKLPPSAATPVLVPAAGGGLFSGTASVLGFELGSVIPCAARGVDWGRPEPCWVVLGDTASVVAWLLWVVAGWVLSFSVERV